MGIQNQSKALLKERGGSEGTASEGGRGWGDDMEDTGLVEEEGSSEKVGFREVGKRRKVARQGRFSVRRGSSGGGRLDVEEVIR